MDLEPTNIVAADQSAIEQITRGEVEIQVDMAHRYPRRLDLSYKRAQAMATQTPEVAAACFYALPRGGKTIEGPSVRLAEIVAATWGNMRAGSRVIDIGETFVTAQGVCWDLETNYWITSETRRRITGRSGKRYNDDMVGTTANAACAIAYREAVFRCVGKTQVEELWQECRRVAVGDARSMAANWDRCVNFWAKAGVDEQRVLASVGCEDASQITVAHLATLRGFSTSIQSGDTSIDDVFPPPMGEVVKGFGFKRPPQKSEPERAVARETNEQNEAQTDQEQFGFKSESD